ncbi:MAG: hypothetical protein OXH29_07640 [bacterium]|nr:hypothetical protein [bacterium]
MRKLGIALVVVALLAAWGCGQGGQDREAVRAPEGTSDPTTAPGTPSAAGAVDPVPAPSATAAVDPVPTPPATVAIDPTPTASASSDEDLEPGESEDDEDKRRAELERLEQARLAYGIDHAPCRPIGRTGFPMHEDTVHSTGIVRVAVLFVEFPDAEADYTTHEEIGQSLDYMENYLESASYGRLDVEFSLLHKWLKTENERDFYNIDGRKEYGPDGWQLVGVTIQSEAIRLAGSDIDLSETDAILVVMPSVHFSGGNAGGRHETQDGNSYWMPVINGMNTIGGPEGAKFWGYIAAHEFTHGLGLNDLYAHVVSRPDLPPDKRWSVAEFGLMGLDVNFPTDSSFYPRTYAFEMLAWSRWLLGWLQPEQVSCITGQDAVIPLSPIAEPGDGIAMAAIPLSETEVIVIESRRKLGYDTEENGNFLDGGVFVYTVDVTLGSGELPLKIGEDAGNGYIERSPILGIGESVNVRGYSVTFESSSPETDTVVITKTGG